MTDPKNLEILVEQAVDTVLNHLLPELREQLVRQVIQALGPELASAPAPPPGPPSVEDETDKLNRSLAAIQAGTTQVEILDAMIEGASQFACRTALFVVRGANAVGWRARGFSDNETVRSIPLELSEGLAAKAIQTRGLVSGPCSEFMVDFEEKAGAPPGGGNVLPLMVRDKVVAILYADGGLDHQNHLDSPALQSLVRIAGLWLEVFATRKSAAASAAAPPAMAAATSSISRRPAEPVASAAAAAPAPEAPPAAPPASEAPSQSQQSAPVLAPGEEGEVHKKARRFAKLLVDEIKLYNQGKVTEGRQNRDLYDRLKDDIEKSRASYEKRYGATVAKEGDYFNQELVRILADNDVALFGNNFRR